MVKYGEQYRPAVEARKGWLKPLLAATASAVVAGLVVYTCTSKRESPVQSIKNTQYAQLAKTEEKRRNTAIQKSDPNASRAITTSSFTPFPLRGSISIVSSSSVGGGGDRSIGAFCQGTNGYDDIREGAPVNVYNNSGSLIAQGRLSQGSFFLESIGCRFTFDVQIAKESDFYFVEISHRGRTAVDAQRARSGFLELSL